MSEVDPHDPFPDWRCLRCGMVSTGSRVDDAGEEAERTACKFCQAPKPDLTGWVWVPPGRNLTGAFWRHPQDRG